MDRGLGEGEGGAGGREGEETKIKFLASVTLLGKCTECVLNLNPIHSLFCFLKWSFTS